MIIMKADELIFNQLISFLVCTF